MKSLSASSKCKMAVSIYFDVCVYQCPVFIKMATTNIATYEQTWAVC